jgi:hypothetical protein
MWYDRGLFVASFVEEEEGISYVPSPLLDISVDAMRYAASEAQYTVERMETTETMETMDEFWDEFGMGDSYQPRVIAFSTPDRSRNTKRELFKALEVQPAEITNVDLANSKPRRKGRLGSKQWGQSAYIKAENKVGKKKEAYMKWVASLNISFELYHRCSPMANLLFFSILICTVCALSSFAPAPIGIMKTSGEADYAGKPLHCQGVARCLCPRQTICAKDLHSLWLLGVRVATTPAVH